MKTISNEKKDNKIQSIIIVLIMACLTIYYLFPFVINYAKPKYEKIFWEECVKQDEQIPLNTELLISACVEPEVRGVPEGNILFVREEKTGEVYILDLRTGEKKQVPNDPDLLKRGVFLSSELVWLEGTSQRNPHYVFDLKNGQKYKLIDLTSKINFNPVLDNGDTNPDLFPYFTDAEQVFLSYDQNAIIALYPDFRYNLLKRGIYFDQGSLWEEDDYPEGDYPENGELLVKLLKDLRVDYKIIDFYDYINYAEIPEIPSPTGKHVVRNDGIYYSDTEIPLILEHTGEVDMNDFVSWYYDESSIVLAVRSYYYVADFPWVLSFSLPRPVIKLTLPSP